MEMKGFVSQVEVACRRKCSVLCFAHVGASPLGLYQGNSQFLMFPLELDSFLASVHYVTAQSLIRFLFFSTRSFIHFLPRRAAVKVCGFTHFWKKFTAREGYCPGDNRYTQLASAICGWYILAVAEAKTRPSATVSSH